MIDAHEDPGIVAGELATARKDRAHNRKQPHSRETTLSAVGHLRARLPSAPPVPGEMTVSQVSSAATVTVPATRGTERTADPEAHLRAGRTAIAVATALIILLVWMCARRRRGGI